MTKRFYTIGVAGHIDHGKTTLTKALTSIDTDRLKEEQERGISIELGYAPLRLGDDVQVSIIDVPGHERFIRQMIAGVAGIDLVLLVVAADEGIMPQTVEHLDILQLLGIQNGMIVVTKTDQVEAELIDLIKLEITEQVKGTFMQPAEVFFVDSISKKGIAALQQRLQSCLQNVPMRDASGPFRLPIDQVFTIHGQGTIVRGTVFEGEVREGEILELLPLGKKVRARQLQVHHQRRPLSRAGQRTAVNLGGISASEVKRGDVLVSTEGYCVTTALDVALDTLPSINYPLKQRGNIKLHLGTAEVFGKIVLFDRNELAGGGEVLCQLRLDTPVVAKRGDRFILRRPSPVETVGGGTVIDPRGEKHAFGEATITMLSRKKEGSPSERLVETLKIRKALPDSELIQEAGLTETEGMEQIKNLVQEGTVLRLASLLVYKGTYNDIAEVMKAEVTRYHEHFPLRPGINKAEISQKLSAYGAVLAEAVVEKTLSAGVFQRKGQSIAANCFVPGYPRQWEIRMKQVEAILEQQGLEVEDFQSIVDQAGVPGIWQEELRHYLLRTERAVDLGDKHLVWKTAFDDSVARLRRQAPPHFHLQDAKAVLKLSRKYLVPLLEQMDAQGLTKRSENGRMWIDHFNPSKLPNS
ncbi:selenocysteine-specific elongation factor [Evansella caseinilytica]|uniref:Selenocysteine-specific elongation factor n=1 Tax=Evansella caseinilytica TaxID=1503961 RepID=A0A1H3SYG4_9BACI|nr:selenocysteine-specific translation elongation factor [Evansella caseinilytica]SDZ43153.1 selenocysteine-specific elongation factor [Evansella caseinilytica]